MVEIAYLSATRGELMVVMDDFDSLSVLDKQPILDREREDLNRGHDFLCSLLHQKGIPLFDDIETAVVYANNLVTQSESIASLSDDPYVREPVIRGANVSMIDAAHDVFQRYTDNQVEALSVWDTRLALKSLLGGDVTEKDILQILRKYHGATSQGNHPDNGSSVRYVTQSEFCFVVAAVIQPDSDSWCEQYPQTSKPAPWPIGAFLNPLRAGVQLLWRWKRADGLPEGYDISRQVFLGGSCGSKQCWREDIAIPLLLQHGVDFFNPNVANWTPRLIPLEAQAKKNCSVLLFVPVDTHTMCTVCRTCVLCGIVYCKPILDCRLHGDICIACKCLKRTVIVERL
eukprot:m.883728 g.883728  ORF g.883728 m.883728 type:complete len:343 (+) comp23612_c0_seq1:1284-2312(+)